MIKLVFGNLSLILTCKLNAKTPGTQCKWKAIAPR